MSQFHRNLPFSKQKRKQMAIFKRISFLLLISMPIVQTAPMRIGAGVPAPSAKTGATVGAATGIANAFSGLAQGNSHSSVLQNGLKTGLSAGISTSAFKALTPNGISSILIFSIIPLK